MGRQTKKACTILIVQAFFCFGRAECEPANAATRRDTP
jgi:hypothetical protein